MISDKYIACFVDSDPLIQIKLSCDACFSSVFSSPLSLPIVGRFFVSVINQHPYTRRQSLISAHSFYSVNSTLMSWIAKDRRARSWHNIKSLSSRVKNR